MEGKVRIDGNINTYIMYMADGEQTETRGINTSLDFSEVLEMEQSKEGANITLVSNVNSIECKVINERKISLKATLELKITITADEEMEIIESVREENSLQILREKTNINSLIGRGTTKVHGKDTIQIDVADNLAEILKASVTLIDKDTKISYNKVLAKTDAEVKILYLTEENNIKLVTGKIPLVGFVDLPNITENSICNVNYELQNLIIKPNSTDEHSIYVELETEVVCEGYETKEINIVRDIYSPYENIEIGTKVVNTASNKKIIREKNQIRQNVNIPDMDNKRILDVEANPKIKDEHRGKNDVKYECEMELNFVLLNTLTSKVETNQQNISFDFATNILEEGNVIAELAVVAEDYIVESGNSVVCNIDVEFLLSIENNVNLQVIDEIQENGERERQLYSVIIYLVKKGDTLWKIAKRFGATVEDIVKINGIENPDKIDVGQKIFIPRFYKVPQVVNG